MRWLITGGAGFIGSNFIRMAFRHRWVNEITVLDALTYAGHLEHLAEHLERPGFQFIHGDITYGRTVEEVFSQSFDAVFHFAAESHVDRSIVAADAFVRTNVLGTQILLDAARAHKVKRFIHISTDEVYGALSLQTNRRFLEDSAMSPTSPYAASKAASDMLVLAAHRTHGLDTVITRCSNNYGPYQHEEKFIPLFITRALKRKPMPLYGDGLYVRDWIYVDNHCLGIYQAYCKGKTGEVYNLGGECERSNLNIANMILELTCCPYHLLKHVSDRAGHDRRYAIDCMRARKELGFDPGLPIEKRLPSLIHWYQQHYVYEKQPEVVSSFISNPSLS
jgi:dTDP-glucose 4,6-dehydratase